MILHSLRLRGFKGLRAGVGLEEIFIDFDKLPLGLVAIVGANGMGKTTIMDNMHPYRLMPYKLRKAKDWSPAAFSFYDQCCGTDALKELVFTVGDKQYRSVVMIDAERRKQEAYLYRLDEDSSWDLNKVVWESLNDGKTRTYDEAVEKVVGSPTLFFSSVFRSQGAKNLSDYSRGDIVAIVSELLNIDHIKEQGEKARQVVNTLVERSGRIGIDIEAIERELAGEREVERKEIALNDSIDFRTGDITRARQKEDAARKQLAEAEQRQTARQTDEERLRSLEKDGEGIRKERQQVLGAIEEKKESARRRRERIDQDLSDAGAVLAQETAGIDREATEDGGRTGDRLKNVEERLDRARKIAGKAADIRARVEDEKAATADLAAQKGAIDIAEKTRAEIAEEVSRLEVLRRRHLEVSGKLSRARQEHEQSVRTAERDLEAARREAGKLDGIDCRADASGWVNSACRFVTDAVAAREKIPALEQTLAAAQAVPQAVTDLEAEEKEALAAIAALEKAPAAMQDNDKALAILRQRVAALESSLIEIARWTKLVPDLDRAESDILELSAEAATIRREQEQSGQRFEARRQVAAERHQKSIEKATADRAEIDGDLDRDTADLKEKLSRLGDRADALDGEIFGLRKSLAEDLTALMASLRRQMEEAGAAIAAAEQELQRLHGELGRIRWQLEAFAQKRQEKATLETRRARIDREAVNWKVLAKACSNDGVIALEIDDAGPSIAALANDLLNACYGPRFSVRLETQTTKADGTMKEDFDILIFDADTDEWVSITEKSGGQTTWIEDAITRAICLYNIHRSDRTFGSLFSDEKDGALDAERKIEFLAVKRRAMEIGTHSREFFISQTPELVEMADARIRLLPGKVEVA